MQFTLNRLFFVVTISAILAAVCRVAGLRIVIVPAMAVFAFAAAVLYRAIGRHSRDQQSAAARVCLATAMLIVLLMGMAGVAMFLALLAGV